jgi:hypothetical protein
VGFDLSAVPSSLLDRLSAGVSGANEVRDLHL